MLWESIGFGAGENWQTGTIYELCDLRYGRLSEPQVLHCKMARTCSVATLGVKVPQSGGCLNIKRFMQRKCKGFGAKFIIVLWRERGWDFNKRGTQQKEKK